jgi:thioredoxin reductase
MAIDLQDVIIIGGGPAGLNAAVVLGRCQRKVLIFDNKQYRNRWSHGMHNYLTQDDIAPLDFIKVAHKELKKYRVKVLHRKVINARKGEQAYFVVKDDNGGVYHAKKMLVATGLVDNLPEIEGFKELYGKSIHHCPYCDGWEARGKKLGVYARNKEGWELALALRAWSDDVTLYTDGLNKVKSFQKEVLDANGIPVIKLPIARVEGTDGQLQKIIFKNGEEQLCETIFFVNGFKQQCDLAETIGCEVNKKGVVITNHLQQTKTPGLYVAGDASRDMHFVVVAAAEGAKAGVMINKELQKELSAQNLDQAKSHTAKRKIKRGNLG